MKIKNILRFCAAALLALPFASCQQEELVKPSALMSESSLSFAATDAEPQDLTIASDDYWMIDVAEDWLTVEPMSGYCTQKVTVSVNNNVKDGVVNRPRQATLTIANNRGYSIKTIIYQSGDNYLGVSEMPISSVLVLKDGEFAKIPEAQVMALTSEGFVATDKSGSIYITSKEDVTLGDNVYLAGEKSTLYGNAVLNAGDVQIKSNAELVYPTPVNLESNLDPSNANKIMYISTYAGLLGTSLKYDASLPVSVSLLDPKVGLFDIEAVNMHNLDIEAYFIGLDKDEVKLALTKFEDKGINENLKAYFFDDFSWMKPFLEEYAENGGKPVGDSVGEDNPSAEAPNLRTVAGLAKLLDEFIARGYEDLNQAAKVIYPQAYYWKFGKTSNHGGIKLPKLDLMGSELLNIDLEFDWSPHMTGSGNIDKVSIVAEIVEGNGAFENGTKISDPFVHSLEKGDLGWHHVNTMIKGADNTTRIIIRPLQYSEATPDQQRWHLDNIKISDSDIPYSDPVYANISVSDEIVTFEGVPSGPFELKIKSDNPWTLTKSIDSDWFEVDITEGDSDEEVTVTITCQSSTVSTLRKGVLALASADTRKNIHVVQSAAGGDLEPLISIVGGNKGTVGFDGGSFVLGVQSNVHYEYESDASWVSVQREPVTKAIVETTGLTITYEANTQPVARTARIKIFNTLDNLESIYTLTQDAFDAGVYFQDNFDWLSELATANGAGDSIGEKKSASAPNAHNIEGFADLLASCGYEDLFPSSKTIYLQSNYLKFSKGEYINGIRLPAVKYGETVDAVLSFDWGTHIGSGGADEVELVVVLEGNGTVNRASTTHTAGNWTWQNEKFYLSGVDDNTRIVIKPNNFTGEKSSGYYRWYLDNIKITKPKAEVLAAWDLTAEGNSTYANTWNGPDVVTKDKTAGDGGKYIAANAGGNGKITYVQIDKTELDEKDSAARVCGKDGEPYITGAWPGDSWNLTAESSISAGSLVGVSYYSRTSGTGMKYWLVEYLDGETWKPALPVQTVEVEGQTISYNIEHMNTDNFEVNFVATTTADMSSFKVRQTCVVNAQASGKGPLAAPNGGTIRLKGGDIAPKIVKY